MKMKSPSTAGRKGSCIGNYLKGLVIRHECFLGLLVLASGGMALILLATPLGCGISPDSIEYINGSRNLLSGNGYSTTYTGDVMPITNWPPGFSLTLAGLGLFGIDPVSGARWLNAVLMGANILMVGLVTRQATGGLGVPSILAAFLCLTSADILWAHSYAWSEPLFILLILTGLFSLNVWLQRPRVGLLLASGLAFGGALATRHIGLPMLAGGLLALLAFDRQRWTARLRNGFFFGLMGVAPAALFALRNQAVSGEPTNWHLTFHPMSPSNVAGIVKAVGAWVVPEPAGPFSLGHKVMLVCAAALVAFGAAWLLYRKIRALQRGDASREGTAQAVCLVLIASYTAFLIGAICFLRLDIAVEIRRFLVPLHVLVLCIAVGFVFQEIGAWHRRKTFILVAFGLVILIASAINAGSWLYRTRMDAQGYASRTWRTSEVIAWTSTLPPQVRLVSNQGLALNFLTGRPVRELPIAFDAADERPVRDWQSNLKLLAPELEDRGGFIIYFLQSRRIMPSLQALESALPLVEAKRFPDAVILTLQ
jgi:hypothetical protein